MKQISFIAPIDFIRGSISGRQSLEYDSGNAYDIPVGSKVAADAYQPRMIAKVTQRNKYLLRFFQVRTRSTVNMTAAMKLNLALMGGAGALYASLVSDKTSAIYLACMAAVPKGYTLRAFVMPLIRAGLAAKESDIAITSGVSIVNPWISSATPNLTVSAAILAKFNSELSNT